MFVHDPVVYDLCDDNLYTLMYFDTVEKSLCYKLHGVTGEDLLYPAHSEASIGV